MRFACIALAALGLLVTGCTRLQMIRSNVPSPGATRAVLAPPTADTAVFEDCKTGFATSGERREALEVYPDYLIGYAEFDDQGWAYQDDRQVAAVKSLLQAELSDPAHEAADYLVLVFVHGWHHNAHDNDCNVQEFRQMVRIAAGQAKAAIGHGLTRERRVIGLYVGWRGESVDAAGLRYGTVLDRRNAAERVAKGSVRQLFADIHEAELLVARARPDKLRTVVIGHSFGGLIAHAALSQGLLNDLTREGLDEPHACVNAESAASSVGTLSAWPDGLVLINPAFESSRFEPLHRLVARRVACTPSGAPPMRLVVPNMIVVTADNDHWTGGVFTAGRAVLTLFDGYDHTDAEATRRERRANLHAIGFNEDYRTHVLTLVGAGAADKRAVAHATPTSTGVANTDAPIWVISAPPSIINGHNGFLYARHFRDQAPQPYLAEWLMHLYAKDCSVAPEMVGCAPRETAAGPQ